MKTKIKHTLYNITKRIHLRTYIALGLIVILGIIALISAFRPGESQATWFDQGYSFRRSFSFTHNAALTDRRVQVTVDTATLITASKMQADCDDSRFTDINGKVLRYQLTGTCNNAATTYDVLFPTIINGTNSGYFYYGNPSAVSGSEDISGFSSLSPSGGAPSFASEEVGTSPIAYWNLDDGQGTTAQDQTLNNKDGSISGATWQTDSQCIRGNCLFFDGSNDVVTVASSVAGIQTVSFWAKVNSVSTTEQLIDLNGTDYIQSVSGTITANSFGTETVYVNGKPGTTITANTWNHIEVTTSSGLTGSAIKLAQVSTNYGQTYLDEIKLYGYARTASQVQVDYNMGANVLGISDQSYLSDGLVGHWKMDEASGDAADSSGNGLTLTNNGSTTFGAGKFGNAPTFNGSSKYFSTASTINNIQSVAFWAKPANTTDNFINLITGTAYISSSSGTVAGTGFSGAQVYVNGNLNGTITANAWNHVVVTSTAGINTNAFNVGRANGNYAVNNSQIDSIRLYSRALTSAEVSSLYNWAPGPVGYWKFDENTGTTSHDSSTNGLDGTNTNGESTDWAPAKLGSGLKLDGVDEKVTVSDNNTLDITAGVSSMGWVNVTTAGALVYDTIAHDADSSSSAANTGSLTFAHTVANQNNRMLLVGVSTEDSVEADQTVSGITYNSVAMSLARGRTQAATTNRRAELWYLAAPSVGTHDIVITFGGTTTSIAAGATSLYNVAQQAPEATAEAGTGNGTSTTVNITTLTNNAWVVDSAMNGSTGGFTQPGDQIERWDVTASGHQGAGSTKVVATAGATTVQETNSGGASGASHVAAAFAPSSTIAAAILLGKGNDAYNLTLSSALTITATINASNQITATLTSGWHHIAMTYDGAMLRLYLDGIQQSSTAVTGAIGTNATDLTIGQYINGVIDDFKIYNYGRSNRQIIEDMNGGNPIGGATIGSETIYWKFDEQQGTTANNSIAGSTSGTVSNALWKAATGGQCKINGCLSFDGTGDVVTIATASDANVDFNGSEQFSGSAWVYPTSVQGSTTQKAAIIAKYDATTPTRGYRMYLENDDTDSTGNFEVEIYDESTDQVITASSTVDGVSANNWYHVAFTFNGGTSGAAGDLKLYVNGAQFNNSANASFLGLEDVTADFTVGEYDVTDTEAADIGFSGYIDEAKVYAGLLTAEQVKTDMNNGSSLNFGTTASSEASLLADGAGNAAVLYAAFDENTGSSPKDTSGNNLTLTVTGSPTWATGKYGSALTFDGSTTKISATITDPAYNNTVEAWVYPTTSAASKNIVTASKLATDSSSRPTYGTCVGTALTLNTWTHIAAVSNGSGACQIYQNGIQTATNTTGVTFGTSAIIADNASSNGFIGRMDEVKLYDYARTQSQIAYDYNRGIAIGWWKLDDCQGTTAYDASGNGYNGTLTIGASGEDTVGDCLTASTAWGSGASGKYNSSLSFDGTDDYINIYSSGLASAFNRSEGTISAWAKVSSSGVWTDGAFREVVRLYADSQNYILLRKSSTNNTFHAQYTAGNTNKLVNIGALSPTDWFQVAITWSKSSDQVKIYLNGIQSGTTQTTLGTWSGSLSNTDTVIGAANTSASEPWSGQIDDVRIFNYALSAAQVRKLYNENANVRFGPASGNP